MLDNIYKEMNRRGAKHCVMGLIVNGQTVLAMGTDAFYFNDNLDYIEWCELQEIIHDTHRIVICAVHVV